MRAELTGDLQAAQTRRQWAYDGLISRTDDIGLLPEADRLATAMHELDWANALLDWGLHNASSDPPEQKEFY